MTDDERRENQDEPELGRESTEEESAEVSPFSEPGEVPEIELERTDEPHRFDEYAPSPPELREPIDEDEDTGYPEMQDVATPPVSAPDSASPYGSAAREETSPMPSSLVTDEPEPEAAHPENVGPPGHTKRDGETMMLLGGFLGILAVPVLIGTAFAERANAMMVNAIAGAVILAIGVGLFLRGRFVRRA